MVTSASIKLEKGQEGVGNQYGKDSGSFLLKSIGPGGATKKKNC